MPPGYFVNDAMITSLRYSSIFSILKCFINHPRYLLSVNSHGIVTCTLDYLNSMLQSMKGNLFSLLHMKVMIDKLEPISLEKVKG